MNIFEKAADGQALEHLYRKVMTALKGFVKVETGKGLSTNDFSNEYKEKLDKLSEGGSGSASVDWNDITNKPELGTIYEYKGSVATFEDLPAADAEGLKPGHVYNVEGDDDMNYGWTGTKWDPLGSKFKPTYLTTAELDEMMAKVDAELAGGGETNPTEPEQTETTEDPTPVA